MRKNIFRAAVARVERPAAGRRRAASSAGLSWSSTPSSAWSVAVVTMPVAVERRDPHGARAVDPADVGQAARPDRARVGEPAPRSRADLHATGPQAPDRARSRAAGRRPTLRNTGARTHLGSRPPGLKDARTGAGAGGGPPSGVSAAGVCSGESQVDSPGRRNKENPTANDLGFPLRQGSAPVASPVSDRHSHPSKLDASSPPRGPRRPRTCGHPHAASEHEHPRGSRDMGLPARARRRPSSRGVLAVARRLRRRRGLRSGSARPSSMTRRPRRAARADGQRHPDGPRPTMSPPARLGRRLPRRAHDPIRIATPSTARAHGVRVAVEWFQLGARISRACPRARSWQHAWQRHTITTSRSRLTRQRKSSLSHAGDAA